MSDDSGGGPSGQGRGPGRQPLRLDLLYRAMRWETFVLAAVLVVLAAIFA
ncbi:hypothetical protein [Streptomyces iconiensis]|uniref:Uncharacterized protein n=1 Tax=Streptomyces iconiensis TaxID=1384038 RepID=A0ABT7A0H7_9ACTN|nr:hypothetical protein [Streptomyces iconiensis]MDJ1134559.1 hypothetical protein [Streptomyces iconiensis]